MGFRVKLAIESMSAPPGEPNVGNLHHLGGGPLSYICNMAVAYWGLRAYGVPVAEASEHVARLIRAECAGCQGKSKTEHRTTARKGYANWFLGGAQAMTLDQIRRTAERGDVMILGPINEPPHSVVVVENNAGQVFVRGWNNNGTFMDPDICRAVLAERAALGHHPGEPSSNDAAGSSSTGGGAPPSVDPAKGAAAKATPFGGIKTKVSGILREKYVDPPYMKHDYRKRGFDEIKPTHLDMQWYLLRGRQFKANITSFLSGQRIAERLKNEANSNNNNSYSAQYDRFRRGGGSGADPKNNNNNSMH